MRRNTQQPSLRGVDCLLRFYEYPSPAYILVLSAHGRHVVVRFDSLESLTWWFRWQYRDYGSPFFKADVSKIHRRTVEGVNKLRLPRKQTP